MSLWVGLQNITRAGGLFSGTTPADLTVMLQHLRDSRSMRYLSNGRPVNLTQERVFERGFRSNLHLTREQCGNIYVIFDRHITEASRAALHRPAL